LHYPPINVLGFAAAQDPTEPLDQAVGARQLRVHGEELLGQFLLVAVKTLYRA
jgi:hypothetical protein